jgi:transcriptional regulator with XRE-family HTH domain
MGSRLFGAARGANLERATDTALDPRAGVGVRLAALRGGTRRSQEELAKRAGISVKTISRLEKGRYDGRRDTIRRRLDAFDVEESALFGEPLGTHL